MTLREIHELGERAEALAWEQFPKADRIFANPAFDEGPFVEVWVEGAAQLFRYVGWEQ